MCTQSTSWRHTPLKHISRRATPKMYAERRFWDANDDQSDRSIHCKTSYHSLILTAPFWNVQPTYIWRCDRINSHINTPPARWTLAPFRNGQNSQPSSLKISHKCIKMHRFALVQAQPTHDETLHKNWISGGATRNKLHEPRWKCGTNPNFINIP